MSVRSVLHCLLLASLLAGSQSMRAESQMESINVPNDHCGCTCVCILPWLVADRWNDHTNISGYPEWNGNGNLDRENFTDLNGDDFWQPGEDYNDGNGNNAYDMEFYHPLITGYTSDNTGGEPIVVRSRYQSSGGSIRTAVEILFSGPGLRGSTPSIYMQSILGCYDTSGLEYPHSETRLVQGNMNRVTVAAVGEIIAKDPEALLNDSGSEVLNSRFEISPRVGLLAFRDPRNSIKRNGPLRIVKYASVFMESVDEHGEVMASFMWLQAPPFQTCKGSTENLFVYVPFEDVEQSGLAPGSGHSQSQHSLRFSWGRIKATHR